MKEGPEMNRRKFLGVLGASVGAAATVAFSAQAEAGEAAKKLDSGSPERLRQFTEVMNAIAEKTEELRDAYQQHDTARMQQIQKELDSLFKRGDQLKEGLSK